MKRIYIAPLILLSVILVSMSVIVINMNTALSMSSVQKNTITTFSKLRTDSLYKEIQNYAVENKIEPIDATIDKVWKAIPGYNGLEVDIEASYKKMKSGGKFKLNKLVHKEIKPAVHLDDLDPAPIYRGNPEKPMVSLLINVAWGNEYIPVILETLEKSEVKATFFFDGSWVKKNPELTKLIYDGGHEIGNHAYSHPNLQQKSKAETIEELTMTNDVIIETLGIKPKWFAPPSGSFNQNTIEVADELGMKTILWTVDTVDWKKPSPSEMIARVMKNGMENGTMILMHPTKPVAEGLETLIQEIEKKGHRLGTVSDMMSEKRIVK